MFKKVLYLVIIILIVLMSTSFPVFAAENPEVSIDIVAHFSDAKDQSFVVYFRNIKTDEVVEVVLDPIHKTTVDYIEPGEYELEKCVLAIDESMEYEVVSTPKNLVVTEGEEIINYTFRIDEHSKSHGSEEAKKTEDHIKRLRVGSVIYLLLLPVAIAWIVFAIMGRRSYYKKTIAQLLKHMLYVMLGLCFGIACAPDFDVNPAITIIVCACFPFGFIFVAQLLGKTLTVLDVDNDGFTKMREQRELENINKERDSREHSGAGFLIGIIIFTVLCCAFGVIVGPIVITKDIITIVKSRDFDYKCW